jgi:hypothetical protein
VGHCEVTYLEGAGILTFGTPTGESLATKTRRARRNTPSYFGGHLGPASLGRDEINRYCYRSQFQGYLWHVSPLEKGPFLSVSFINPKKAFAQQAVLIRTMAEKQPISFRQDERMRTTPVAAMARTASC